MCTVNFYWRREPKMLESSPVFHLGGLSEREQTIGLLERGTVVTRYNCITQSWNLVPPKDVSS
jgi:hypothetical protein